MQQLISLKPALTCISIYENRTVIVLIGKDSLSGNDKLIFIYQYNMLITSIKGNYTVLEIDRKYSLGSEVIGLSIQVKEEFTSSYKLEVIYHYFYFFINANIYYQYQYHD